MSVDHSEIVSGLQYDRVGVVEAISFHVGGDPGQDVFADGEEAFERFDGADVVDFNEH